MVKRYNSSSLLYSQLIIIKNANTLKFHSAKIPIKKYEIFTFKWKIESF